MFSTVIKELKLVFMLEFRGGISLDFWSSRTALTLSRLKEIFWKLEGLFICRMFFRNKSGFLILILSIRIFWRLAYIILIFSMRIEVISWLSFTLRVFILITWPLGSSKTSAWSRGLTSVAVKSVLSFINVLLVTICASSVLMLAPCVPWPP